MSIALPWRYSPPTTAPGVVLGEPACTACEAEARRPSLAADAARSAWAALFDSTAEQRVATIILACPVLFVLVLAARGVVVWAGSPVGALVGFTAVVGALGCALVWAEQRGGRSAAGGFRRGPVIGRAHGYGRTVLRHEGGHLVAAAETGARVRSARVFWTGGGEVCLHRRDAEQMSPRDYVAFMRAGRYAAGTGAGCWHDDKQVETERARLVNNGMRPAAARRIVEQGDADARRYGRSAQVEVFADRLGERGHL